MLADRLQAVEVGRAAGCDDELILGKAAAIGEHKLALTIDRFDGCQLKPDISPAPDDRPDRLRCELHISVNAALSTADSHAIAEEVRHRLLHELPGLEVVTVHVDPAGAGDYHALVAHHAEGGAHAH